MPARNSRKLYIDNGYYHIYNRGVEKRKIFQDSQDYKVFLSYLKNYLLPKDIDTLQNQLANSKISWKEKSKILKQLRLNNFSNEITLLAYCLMPNHYHLLIRQKSFDSLDRFMNSLATRYVMYFNKKYERVGPLFQGVYKAVLVKTDEQLVHLSAYIHKNPSELFQKGQALENLIKQPSSLPEYIGARNSNWVSTSEILKFFSAKSANTSYERFVLGYKKDDSIIERITID